MKERKRFREGKLDMGNNQIHFLSTYPPRECGIATFCSDLLKWVQRAAGEKYKCRVIAMNDNSCSTYNYPSLVKMQIHEEEPEDYFEVAEQINNNDNIKALCIQHEFGIFGGDMGEYLLPLLEEVKKPIVTTFHSISPGNPDIERHRKYVVRKICEHSDKIVVISGFGHDILKEKYGIPQQKIVAIPHGVPKIAYGDNDKVKRRLGLKGRTVLSTFGLMSKRKGIHYVIKALPKIVKEHPEVLYLVIGETHPIVRKNSGERYRKELTRLVKKLGLKENVAFYNRFLPLKELCDYIHATDIYLTPYYDPQQISSGTLAYAIGAGKACVSTPYLYARDALRDDRGMFVRFRSSNDFAEKINQLIVDPSLRQSLELNAYTYSRAWLWENIGNSYLHLFKGLIKNKG